MYDNDFGFYPDGLTEVIIDALIAEAFGPQPAAHLPRRERRDVQRVLGNTVRELRTYPILPVTPGDEDGAAA